MCSSRRGDAIPTCAFSGGFPFLRLVSSPDPDATRLYYGKSYIYPLCAAPFVLLWGTNGFLVFHALLLARGRACRVPVPERARVGLCRRC